MTISELLAASKQAHLDYRAAIRDQKLNEAHAALARAAALRQQAHDTDPLHRDGSWGEDAGTHALGTIPHMTLHESLMDFYRAELAK